MRVLLALCCSPLFLSPLSLSLPSSLLLWFGLSLSSRPSLSGFGRSLPRFSLVWSLILLSRRVEKVQEARATCWWGEWLIQPIAKAVRLNMNELVDEKRERDGCKIFEGKSVFVAVSPQVHPHVKTYLLPPLFLSILFFSPLSPPFNICPFLRLFSSNPTLSGHLFVKELQSCRDHGHDKYRSDERQYRVPITRIECGIANQLQNLPSDYLTLRVHCLTLCTISLSKNS